MAHFDPFEDIARMHEELDRLFGRISGKRPLLGFKGEGKGLIPFGEFRAPLADVYETENSVIATFELPGADKKDIELNVTENHIEVKVEKEAEKEISEKGRYSYEARAQQFYRALPLPAEVIAERAEATYKDGMLRVEIPKPKAAAEKKRKIEVK